MQWFTVATDIKAEEFCLIAQQVLERSGRRGERAGAEASAVVEDNQGNVGQVAVGLVHVDRESGRV